MKRTALILFFVVAAIQLAVPVTMIVRKERVITSGKVFRFETEPVDPSDPFRGRYIDLNFKASDYTFTKEEEKIKASAAYAIIKENADGFAEIASVQETPPGNADYIKIKLDEDGLPWFRTGRKFAFPFDRFYMDEEKAPHAEAVYRRAQRDTLSTSYALISVWNGGAVITDVMVDGKSVRDIEVPEVEQKN
jgi:uncharacterized membrane-anchored protein